MSPQKYWLLLVLPEMAQAAFERVPGKQLFDSEGCRKKARVPSSSFCRETRVRIRRLSVGVQSSTPLTERVSSSPTSSSVTMLVYSPSKL